MPSPGRLVSPRGPPALLPHNTDADAHRPASSRSICNALVYGLAGCVALYLLIWSLFGWRYALLIVAVVVVTGFRIGERYLVREAVYGPAPELLRGTPSRGAYGAVAGATARTPTTPTTPRSQRNGTPRTGTPRTPAATLPLSLALEFPTHETPTSPRHIRQSTNSARPATPRNAVSRFAPPPYSPRDAERALLYLAPEGGHNGSVSSVPCMCSHTAVPRPAGPLASSQPADSAQPSLLFQPAVPEPEPTSELATSTEVPPEPSLLFQSAMPSENKPAA